jgi:hypothetical protein
MIEKHSPKYIQIMDVINEWDPVNFFMSPYAPQDEYDIEIDYFLPLLTDAPKEEYAKILSDTFEKYFWAALYRNEKG